MSRHGRAGDQVLAPAGALILALAGASSPVHAGVNLWTPIGPDGGSVVDLAVSRAQPPRVYGGSAGGGFYRSEDGGAPWVRASRGIDRLVAASPASCGL